MHLLLLLAAPYFQFEATCLHTSLQLVVCYSQHHIVHRGSGTGNKAAANSRIAVAILVVVRKVAPPALLAYESVSILKIPVFLTSHDQMIVQDDCNLFNCHFQITCCPYHPSHIVMSQPLVAFVDWILQEFRCKTMLHSDAALRFLMTCIRGGDQLLRYQQIWSLCVWLCMIHGLNYLKGFEIFFFAN